MDKAALGLYFDTPMDYIRRAMEGKEIVCGDEETAERDPGTVKRTGRIDLALHHDGEDANG